MWGWGPERWAVSCSPSGYGEQGHGRAERGCWESNVGAEFYEAWTSSHSLALELLSQLPSQSPRLRSFNSLICHGLEPPAPWPWFMGSDPARVPCTLETSLPHFGESILLHPNPNPGLRFLSFTKDPSSLALETPAKRGYNSITRSFYVEGFSPRTSEHDLRWSCLFFVFPLPTFVCLKGAAGAAYGSSQAWHPNDPSIDQSFGSWPTPQPPQCHIQAGSETYTTAHGHIGSFPS